MKRLILAAILATLSLSAFAARQASDIVVREGESCPAGFAMTGGPSYAWTGNGFAFEGWICEDKYRGTTVGN